METITRDEAFALLKKYNKDPFHIQHALTVEAVMKWYANELGYGEDAEYWGIVGLLHDIDFELYPEEHCLQRVHFHHVNIINSSYGYHYINNRDFVNKFFAQKQMSFCDSFCKNIELTAYIRYLFLNSSIIFGFR